MQLMVSSSAAAMAVDAAQHISKNLRKASVIGVATGRTPLALYKSLAGQGDMQLSGGFALDEYLGVGADHPGSFANYVMTNVEPALKLEPGFIRVPNGLASNPHIEAQAFEEEIAKRPIDLQILGVGSNGHLAFNEPGSTANTLTRVVDLAEQTRKDNQQDFPGEVPRQAITQGVATIMRAGSLCLLVSGEKKAKALRWLLEETADEQYPVTLIASHPKLSVFTDEKTLALAQQ